jgi:Family of unknown function (DUF5684)
MELMIMVAVGLLQAGGGGGGGPAAAIAANLAVNVISVIVLQLILGACWWGTFAKAGQPGWAGFIPIYREIVLLQITDKPIWWIVFAIVCPFVWIVMYLLILIELANRFGQGAGFAIGMFCCWIIFVPMLSYGSYEYMGGRRRRRRDEDDDDDDDGPRRRRGRDDDDDDDDDRPRRRPPARDDDDDDRGIKRRPRGDD